MSPYRLAAHLTSAAVIYGTLLWTSLSLAYPLSPAASVSVGSAAHAGVSTLRRWAHPLAGLIAVTALSGRTMSGCLGAEVSGTACCRMQGAVCNIPECTSCHVKAHVRLVLL